MDSKNTIFGPKPYRQMVFDLQSAKPIDYHDLVKAKLNSSDEIISGSASITNLTTTTITTSTGLFASGTVLLPSVANSGDVDTGAYWPAFDEFAITTGGTQRALFNATGLSLSNLTAGRVAIIGTSGLVTDDDGLTYVAGTDSLTVAGFLNVGTTTDAAAAGDFAAGATRKLFYDESLGFLQLTSTVAKQLRLAYTSGSVYVDITADSSGDMILGPTNNIVYIGSKQSTHKGLQISLVAASAAVLGFFHNADNTSGTSHAVCSLRTGGSSGGDPYIGLNVNAVTDWSLGIDNSTSDSFKISNAAALGANDRLTITTGGDVTIGSGHLLWATDNTYNIGAVGATRPASIHLGTSAVIGTSGWTISATAATGLTAQGNARFAHGTSALATGATEGFLHLQSCAGTPTGVPASIPTGQIPLVWDSTNNILYAYDGAWTNVAGAGGGVTLDGAYDFGGAGAGRTITVDTGAVTLTGGGTTVGGFTVNGTRTIASAAGAVWNEVLIDADVSLSGSTNVTTATGFNLVSLNGPTITDAGTIASITNAATLYIGDAPSGSGLTVTNAYALWVDSGTVRVDGSIQFGLTNGVISQGTEILTLTGGANGTEIILNSTNNQPTVEIIVNNATSGATTGIKLTESSASTGRTAGSEVLDVDFDFDGTLQHASNTTVATQRSILMRPRAYSFASATGTITNAATLAIVGPPTAGANAAITNAWALWIQGGNVNLAGSGAALATTATSGFPYIPTCAGTPTGVPDALPTGAVPLVYDSTNNKLYIYEGGAWTRGQVAGVDVIWA